MGALALACAAASQLAAQDTAQGGVRVGITYAPGTRPSLAVVRTAALAGLDSVRAIIERDLDQSDRFEMLWRPSAGELIDSAAVARVVRGGQARLLVLVGAEGAAARLTLLDASAGQTVWRGTLPLSGDASSRAWRRRVHQVADQITREVTGQPGYAATSLLFVREGRLHMVDADGFGVTTIRSAGSPSLSPAWSADGRRIVYTAFVASGQPLVVQDLAGGARRVVPGTDHGVNITPTFASDGRLAYAQGTEAGTDIYVWDGGPRSARLTVGRFADNLSPTWSPDGTRIAFISTRARTPQLYVMNADGTDQELLARFDFGSTGTTSSPAWSPDGSLIAFHREVQGTPQVFVLDVASRAVRQLTGGGRNEDPSWAPDGRHLAFVSNRGGGRDLWVMDLETGRLRQLTFTGGARLPAWSPRFTHDAERE